MNTERGTRIQMHDEAGSFDAINKVETAIRAIKRAAPEIGGCASSSPAG